jgi:phage-related protein
MSDADTTGEWTAEFYEDESGRRPVEEWMLDLPEFKRAAVIAAIECRLEQRGINLSDSNWMTPLGDGLHEFRIRDSEAQIRQKFDTADAKTPKGLDGGGILLRVFVHFYGKKICLLLGGYDKKDDNSEKKQNREIATARKRMAEWKRRQQSTKKGVKHQ